MWKFYYFIVYKLYIPPSYLEIIKIYNSFDKENFSLPKKYNSFKPLINKKNKNRLECIMLPFNAILKALKI